MRMTESAKLIYPKCSASVRPLTSSTVYSIPAISNFIRFPPLIVVPGGLVIATLPECFHSYMRDAVYLMFDFKSLQVFDFPPVNEQRAKRAISEVNNRRPVQVDDEVSAFFVPVKVGFIHGQKRSPLNPSIR